jgi:hypothetical protein
VRNKKSKGRATTTTTRDDDDDDDDDVREPASGTPP